MGKLHCSTLKCKDCKEVKRMGEKKRLFKKNEMLYSCKYYPMEHEAIDASDCMHFKCVKKDAYPVLCKTCRG